MRFLLIVFLHIFLLISCKDSTVKNTIEEPKKIVSIDTIFLGYVFDMSKEDVEQKTNDLIKSKKLSKLGNYQMILDDLNHHVGSELFFDYSNDKLYRLTLKINTSYLYSSTELLQSRLLLIYMKKYGIFDEQNGNYFLTESNRKIEILKNNIDDFVIISYTNLPVLEENEAKQREGFKKKYKSVKTDI